MIGSDEMSSTTSMDISETFRPEDLSKTDFFDFVTAPDMGIGIGVGHDRPSGAGDTNGTTNDPALDGYDQFWTSDKDTHSRLESTIFEDLDRYCWQQQQQHHHQQQQQQQPPHHQSQQQTSQTSTQPSHQQQPQQQQQQSHHQSQQQLSSPVTLTPSSSSSQSTANNSQQGGSLLGPVAPSAIVGGNGTTNNSNDNTDGQIYTLTVLNGNEPWIKRDPDAQLPPSLDLDSLLGNFPGYIKSEYPYDDSGFSTDGTKEPEQVVVHQALQSHHLHGGVGVGVTQSTIPPVTTIATTNSTTQLAQFQNNNNDWHMADNNTEQNSAESLLRSALQGKGYSKGMHLQNGITLLPPSPSVKDEELRRALFHAEADSLSFADSALTAQIFDDSQGIGNSTTSSSSSHTHGHVVGQSQLQHQQQQQSANSSNSSNSSNPSRSTQTTSTAAGIIVDDMFLSLETAFTNEFEKIKRIANEVQQFCTASDYPEVIMEITGPQNCVQMQSPQPAQPPPPPPQPLQPEVSTSSNSRPPPTGKGGGGGAGNGNGGSKKYKRTNLNQSNRNNNNNNNSHIANNNNTTTTTTTTSPTHCNGQRKERSLHYCSICSKGFKDKYSVNVHIRTHTGEKPFACSLCGKSFRQKAHLAKHYQTHLAQKSNGSVIKGGSKHQRTSSSSSSSGSAVAALSAQQQRQMLASGSVTTAPSIPNGPSSQPTLPSLPPANGLLANR